MAKQLIPALDLYQRGHAQPGETIKAMVERMSGDGATIRDVRGNVVHALKLSMMAVGHTSLRVELDVDANQIQAFSFAHRMRDERSIISADQRINCQYCQAKTAANGVNASGANIVICGRCGTSDWAGETLTSRSQANLLAMLEGTQHVLTYRG